MPAKNILFIVGDFVEDYEVMVGHNVHTVCPNKKKDEKIKTAVHDFEGDQTYTEKPGHNFQLNFSFDDVKPEHYDALVIPGGRAPEYLRTHDKVVSIVHHFVEAKKPIAALCHGPLLLCAVSGALKDKKVTAYPACKTDVVNAGAHWVGDCGVTGAVVDGNLVTGQAWPGHPAWIAKFLELLGTKIHL